jgi:predicted AAA+ superfamily ATPase
MKRFITDSFIDRHSKNKITILSGPKGAGKTTFVEAVFIDRKVDYQLIDLRQTAIRAEINKLNIEELIWLVNQKKQVLICEGEHLKLLQQLLDAVLDEGAIASVVLTASNTLNLDDELIDAIEYQGLHFYFPPPTFYEYTRSTSLSLESSGIESRLVYGNYHPLELPVESKKEKLNSIIQLMVESHFSAANRINKSEVLMKTLHVLANQIGEALSFNQIATFIEVDNETIERYITLLCMSHIIYKVPCYSTGKTYEIQKKFLFIFLDNGIRNSLLNNFNDLSLRIDIDKLWMNWLIAEKIKWDKLNNTVVQYYFWRSHTRQQVDFLEFRKRGISGYKFKYSKKKGLKTPPLFQKHYPEIPVHTINILSYIPFLTKS